MDALYRWEWVHFGRDGVVCCWSICSRRCFGHDGAHASDESHLCFILWLFTIIPNIVHPCCICMCFLVQSTYSHFPLPSLQAALKPSFHGILLPTGIDAGRPVSTDVRAVADGPWNLCRDAKDGYFLIIAWTSSP